MKTAASVLLLAATVLLAALSLPGVSTQPVRADHDGELKCPTLAEPLHDGVISPGEYTENFFDSVTKVLVYFYCADDAERIMHVALVTPWAEWTEIRIQAVEAWNGDLNVVRASYRDSALDVEDGFLNGTTAQYVSDLSVGGSQDVFDPVGQKAGEGYVYEFGVPLLSPDGYDSQLVDSGSFYFQLAYVTLSGASTEALVVESPQWTIHLGTNPVSGNDTNLEVSLPTGQGPTQAAEVIVGLKDRTGAPLSFRPVEVFAQTVFGFLDLGTVYTNEQGVGAVEYAPRDEGQFLVGASFAGADGYLASVSWTSLVVVVPDSGPSYIPRGLLFIQAVIALVLGGVWATYAYSVFLVRQAMREPAVESRGNRRE